MKHKGKKIAGGSAAASVFTLGAVDASVMNERY